MAGAAHRDLAGAEVGERQPHQPRQPQRQGLRRIHDRGGQHYGSEVSLFAIWNEPNDIASLQPQFNASGQPVSPRTYRGLFQAGYAGLQAAGIAHPKVLMGETAPVGFDSLSRSEVRKYGLLHDVAPLAFLRGALCLNSHYKKAGGCGSVPAYGYSTHAYTQKQGPLWVPPEHDDVTIGTLSRLENALNLAARAGAIRAGIPIYLTEFGVQSVPNRYEGVSPTKQAEYDALAEYIAWKNPRVAAFSQYLLHDDPTGGPPGSGVHGGTVGFQTGLEYVNASPKPLYSAWPIPLVVSKDGHGFSLWGLVRPATRLDQGDDPRQDARLEEVPHAEDRHHRIARLLGLRLERGGRVVESALDEPHRREVRRAGDRGHASSVR